jgi:hypothetical protein
VSSSCSDAMSKVSFRMLIDSLGIASDHCEVPVGAMKQAPDREELKVNVIRQTRTETHLLPEKVTKRARGSGSIFQNGSAVWWIKFHDRGVPRRENSHSTDRRVAEKLLKKRLAEVETQTSSRAKTSAWMN